MLAELIALLFHFVETGRLFYLHRPVYESIGDTPAGQLTADVLNPYFGPSHRSGIPFEVPPELREPDARARVSPRTTSGSSRPTIFRSSGRATSSSSGSSAARSRVWFCQVGVERLLADLQQHEFFKARTLVPLCMAHEGYKQPQQLQVLAYFLSIGQPFDLVINIDGFNEVALSPLNNQQNLDISMPSASHFLPLINLIDKGTLTLQRLQSLAAIARYQERLNRRAGRSTQSQRGRRRSARWLSDLAHGPLQTGVAGLRQPAGDRLRQLADRRNPPDRGTLWCDALRRHRPQLGQSVAPHARRCWRRKARPTCTSFSQTSTTRTRIVHGARNQPSRSMRPRHSKPGVEQGYPVLLAEAATQGSRGANRVLRRHPHLRHRTGGGVYRQLLSLHSCRVICGSPISSRAPS